MHAAARVTCPYCGEEGEVEVDPTGGEEQEFVQDCAVCCRPWRVIARPGDPPEVRVEPAEG